jgi:hypothetical protein
MTAPGDRVEVSSFGQPALDEPTLYPGPTPEHSYLLLKDEVLPLRSAGRGLGDWLVGKGRLDDLLARVGAAPAAVRTVVLAYGSNASPPQLVRKFAGLPHAAVPVVKARAFGLRLTFSAHINPLGYVPAAVRADPQGRLQTWVTLLDDEQLAVLDATERSYDRVVIDGRGRPILEIESGERLPRCALYRTRRRVLDLQACDEAGLISQPALQLLLEAQCGGSFAALAGLFGSSKVPRTAVALLADVPEIAKLGLVVDDGLEPLIGDGDAVYGPMSQIGGRTDH